MKFHNVLHTLPGLILATGFLAVPQAKAATAPRVFYGNSVSICQAALPKFDAALRKRPLAVENEGLSAAFVTCGFTSQGAFGVSASNPTQAAIWYSTTSGTDTLITCTGVSGFHTSPNEFVVKAVTAPASGARTVIFWNAADFAGAPTNFPSGAFSVSCNLPPGGAINDVRVSYDEEIGT